jgi:hypothetical protein
MQRTVLALPLAVLTIAALLATPARAQEAKKTRGKVTALTATNLTLDVAGSPMNFAVDAKTKVEAPGAGTATRRAEAAGKPGVKLTDVIKMGDAVEVSYHDTAGKMQASEIRKVTSVGPSASSSSSASSTTADSKSSSGKVTAISPTSMTISGSKGGGATFTQTFVIDAKTNVIGKGAGTAAQKAGGKVVVTDLIASGDSVSVAFKEMPGVLHASEIRVTMKGTGK